MFFVGDVHGRFEEYKRIIVDLPQIIQLGDMGLGFGKDKQYLDNPSYRFLRGNHDSPAICRKQFSYLGDWGYLKDEGVFYVSGAYSVDKAMRTIDLDWWPEEQLDYQTFCRAIESYKLLKPEIVVSHDCPFDILPYVMGNARRCKRNSTVMALQQMFDAHRPNLWIFAHHHKSRKFSVDGTLFICVGILGVYDSEINQFVT